MSNNIWRRWVSRLFKQNGRTRPRKQRGLSFEALEDRVVPATNIWTGLGTGTTAADWSNINNWSLNRVPITGDTIVFNSTGLSTNRNVVDNLTTNPVLNSVTISGTGYTLGNTGGSTLIVSVGINVASSVNTVSITQPVEFLPPPATPPTTPQATITVDNGSVLDMTGLISASSSVTVSKAGAGTLDITNSNTGWLGAFTLANTNGDGVVQIANAKALGSTTVTINTNTQLQLEVISPTTALNITNTLLINGSGLVGDGALLNVSGNNTWSGPVQMDSDSTFGVDAGTTLTVTGQTTGTNPPGLSDNGSGHNLTKEGPGTLIFPNANSYRGTTTVNNGILEIENPLSLGAGANALDSQSGSPQSETIVNYNPTSNEVGTLELNYNAADTASTDPNALTGAPFQYYENSTVQSASVTNPSAEGGFQVFNDILVLNGPGFSGDGALYDAKGDNEWDGTVLIGSAPPALANPTIKVASNNQLLLSGIVTDPNQASSLTKTGAGELIFNDANTYRGNPSLSGVGTFIDQGILDIADSQALGTGPVNVVSGAALQLDVDQGFDGTTTRTHNRNLGFDSVNFTGPSNSSAPGQELYITGTSGTFTLSLEGQTTTALNVASPTFTSDLATAVTTLLTNAGTGETVSSVTQDGDIYRLLFAGSNKDIPLMTVSATTGSTAVTVNPIYGLTVSNDLLIVGPGVATGPDSGALDSHSGINTYAGPIVNGSKGGGNSTPWGEAYTMNSAAIGVEADSGSGAASRPGHTLADNNYFQWDYSLTVQGEITGGDLIKSGQGDLILPNGNDYGNTTGVNAPTTDIQLGWITIDNNESLGSEFSPLGPNESPAELELPQTLEPYIEIDQGGALHLNPLPSQPNLTLYNNFLLSGNGLTSQDYGLIEQAGAIENLNGDNTLPGIIQLNGNAGIGVEQIPATTPNPPNVGFPSLQSTSPPLTASQLTLTGYLWNYFNPATNVTVVGGLTKLGSRRLIIQGSGTFTGAVNINDGVLLDQNNTGLGANNSTATVTVADGAALEFGNSVNDEDIGNGTTPEMITASENGGVENGIEVWGETLDLNGSGDPTYSDSALSVLAGNAATTGPTVQTVTVTGLTTGYFFLDFAGVATGPISATATAAQVQAALTSILTAGESVVVKQSGNVYTFTFGGSLINTTTSLVAIDSFAPTSGSVVLPVVTSGTYSLSFGGQTTAALTATASAAQVKTALNALTSINGLVSTVTLNTQGTAYIITFSGALATTTLPIELFTGTFATVATTEVGTTSTNLAPANDPIVATDSIWRGPIILGDNTTITTDTNNTLPSSETASRFIATGNISDLYNAASPTSPPPSNLTILGGGEVDLDGQNNTYTGTTYVQQGVLSIGSPLALGSGGVPEIESLTLTGATAGTTQYVLNFPGYLVPGVSTTTDLTAKITYTGNATQDATNVENALNGALSTSSGGEADSAGTVSVVESIVSGTVTIRVTFAGSLSGFPLGLLGASIVSGPGSFSAPTATQVQAGAGGTVVENGASLEVAGSFTVASEPLILEGNGSTADVQTVTLSGGATGNFTLSFTGADSTGTTVTTTTPALSATSTTLTSDIQNALNSPLMTNIAGVGGSATVTAQATNGGGTVFTIVFSGSLSGKDLQTLQTSSSLTGGTVTVATTQVGTADITNVPTQWFQSGPQETDNGQTGSVAGKNQPVSGEITSEAVDPNDPTVMYVGTAGGGVWKSIDNGNSWQPIFDAIPEIQTLQISAGASGSFTLSFTGPDATGTTVTDTTTALNPASLTLALDIQAALDALSNIGGVGGQVTVTQNGSIYLVTFNGTLAGSSLNLLTVNSTALQGTVTPTEFEAGLDPSYNIYVGAVTVDPVDSQIIYVGTGVMDNSTTTAIGGNVNNQYVTNSYYGTGVYRSTDGGLTWQLLVDDTSGINEQGQPVTNPVTGTYLVNPFYGMAVSAIAIDPQTAGSINATIYVSDGTVNGDSPNVGGYFTPYVSLQPNNIVYGQVFYPAFNTPNDTTGVNSNLSAGDGVINGNNGLSEMQTEPGLEAGEEPMADGVISPGGTGQTAGVWRYETNTVNGVTGTSWFNTTDVVSVNRATLDGLQLVPPDLPGPDDDFRISFPEDTAYDDFASVDWTDVTVIDANVTDDALQDVGTEVPVVYATLGTADNVGISRAYLGGQNQTIDYGNVGGANAVYRAYAADTDDPVWYIGDPGVPNDQIESVTITDPSGAFGTYTLNFRNASPNTGEIPFSGPVNGTGIGANDAAAMQSGLNSLGTIGGLTPVAGNVTVTYEQGLSNSNVSVFYVTFGGGLALTPLPLIQVVSYNNPPITNIQVGIVQEGGGADTESQNEFPTEIVNALTDPLSIVQQNGDIQLSVLYAPEPQDNSLRTATVYASVTASFAPSGQTAIQSGDLLTIYESADGGFDWSALSGVPEDMHQQGAGDNAILALGTPVFFGGIPTIYIGGAATDIENPADMLFESTDGGATWTNITVDSNKDTPHNGVHAIVSDSNSQNGSQIIVGTDGGIWQYLSTTTTVAPITTTWSDLNSNLATALVNGVSAAQSNPNDLVVGTENNGLAYTGLAGQTSVPPAWTESDENGASGDGPNGGTVYIDPDNSNIVYAILSNQPPNSSTSNLLESTDGGKSWTVIYTEDDTDYPYFPLLMDPLNPSRILIGGVDGLQQSLNGGQSWITLLPDSLFPTPTDITAIAVAGYQGVFVQDPKFPDVTDIGANIDDPNTIYAASGTQLYVTKDLGLNWVNRSPGVTGNIESITVNPANRDNVFVISQGPAGLGENQIWESTDAGQTWTLIGGAQSTTTGLADNPMSQLVVDPRNGNIYVGTINGVYELANAAPLTPEGPAAAVPLGGAWVRFGIGMPNVSVSTLSLNLSTNTLLAGTNGRGVYQLFLDAPQTATDVIYIYNTNYAITGGSQYLPTTVAPATGAAIGLSGTSLWAGPVALVGDSASNNVTIGSDGTQGIPDGITATTIDFVGQISDANPGGNAALNKDGYGDVIFSGDNTYGGYTTVDQGNLIAENYTALGATSSGTTVIGGASLGLLANLDAEPVNLNGNGILFDQHYLGALRNLSGENTFTGSITVYTPPSEAAAQTETLGADSGSTLTLMGIISSYDGELISLVKEGTGTVILDDTNTYSGTTEIYQGALQAENSDAFAYASDNSNSVSVLDGAQVQLEDPEDVQTITATATSGTFALSYTGPNAAGTTVTDTTTTPLNVTSTTLASDIQSDLNALGNIGGVGGSVTVSQAAYQTITIPAGATGTFTLSFTGNNAAGASVTDVTTLLSLSSTTLITDLENALDALTNIGGVNAFVTVLEPSAGVFTVEFNGSLTGKFVQLLAVNNTAVANGPITVANTFSISFGGALIGEDLQTLTTKNLTLVGGSVVAQTSQIGTSITVPNALNLSGSGIDKTGALLDVGGSDTWSGAVTLDVMPGFTPFTLTTGTVALGAGQYDTVTISGQVSEEPSEAPNIPSGEVPLGIIKVGAGTVALSNANTYTGSTEVSQGILDVQNPNALGNRVTANGLVTIEQLITLSDSKGGEFTLSFDGKNASQALGFGASSSAVQKVLAGSSSGGGGLFAAAGFVNADVQVYRTAIQTTTDNGPSPTDPPSAVTGWIYTLIFEGGTTSYNFAQTPIQLEANGVKGTFASTSIVALGGVDAIVDNNTNGTGELELGNPLTPNTPLVVSKYTLTLNGSGPTGAGALYNLVGDNTWSGPIILAANDALIPPAVTQIGVGVAPATSTTPSSLSLTDVKALSIPVGSVVPVEPELDKLDAGTLIFPSGASFTGTTQYSLTNSPIDLGVTLITAGDVQVDSTVNSTSSPPSGVGPILLNGGTLSGNGSVQSVKNATTNPTGTIDPGDNYPSEASGLLTSSGNVVPYDVTLSSKDTYYVNLGVPTNTNLPPSSTDNNDVLDVTGTIYLGGATLDGLVNTNVAEDDSYTIIKAGNIIGEFVNEGPTNITPVESGALAASVSYIDGVKFEVDYFATRVDVIRELAQVSLALTPSIASPVYGQDEQFVAKLTPETGAPAPTGTVVFKVVDPNGVISTYDVTLPTSPATGSATLDIASVLDAPLIEGGLGYTVTASYNGIDANGNHTFTQLSNIPMTPATITVEPANSTTSLALNFPQPEVYGETFTLTATVATTVASPVINTLAPAGYVSFTDGTTLLGNVFLTSPPPGTTTATAVLSSSTLSVLPIAGNHTIVATYYPNASPDNYSGSANSVGLSIQQDATTVTVTTPPLSPAPVYGQAGVVFTATVTPVSPGGGDPTGNVTFRDGALVLGMGTLSTTNGVTTATYTTTSGQLAEGVNSITATYYGDTNFTGNTGSLSETTTRASSSTTLMSSAPNGIAYGQTVTFTATVAAVYPGGGTPTGTVAFYDGTTLLGDGSLNTVNNLTTATYTTLPFQLPVGSVTLPTNQFITATYLGDGNFTGSTSPALTQEITLASSTTSVNTSGPSVYGQAVTLTATVRPTLSGGVTPTGTVTFYVAGNPNPVGTATLATTGGITTARYTTTLGQLPVGVNETITAVYSGDSHYGSSSGTTSQTVTQDSTTTTVVSSGAAIPGDAITLTSEVVANSPGGGIPTGTVSFTVGSALLGTASLVDINGVTIAQLNVLSSAFPVGPDTVVATYTGDTNFSGSSGSVAESVEDRTTTTVTTSLPAAIYGEPVSLTATIAPITAATLTPSGTVTFMVGNTVLGTATVGTVNGVTSAVLTLTNLPVGTNQTINGFYSGDGIFIGSSGSVLQTVSKTATHTTLVSTLSSIELDQAIILTAQVFPTAPGGGTPTGTITFKDNGTVLGTATLTSGVASLKKAITIVGTNKITAVYGGDTNDLTSTSPVLNVVVGALGTRAMTVKLASSLNPSLVDQSVSFTATVTDGGSGAAHTPTGTVSFYNGTTLLGYATLSGSGRVAKAVFTDATLPQGTDGIVAVYNGSGLFERGGSATLKQVVNAVPDRASGITLVANPTATTYGSPILFSATVSDEGSGAAQTPTGAVTFTATNLATFAVINMGNGTLTGANGIATTTLSYANLPVGTYSINATYNGDGSFYQEGNQSSVVIETVTQGTTAVSLSSSLPNGSFYGQAVTFTATVSVPGSTAAPAGAVSFVNETTGANYGTFAIGANGIVTLKTAALSTGSDEIVATYTGSSNSTTSSASLDQAVYQDASTVTLSTTGNSNAPLTMTAYVAAALPGGGTPTGSVDFYIDGGLVGTEPVNGSNPIVYTYEPGVSTGVHTIEAVYNGDQNFTGNNATVTKTFVVGRQT